MGPNVWCDFLGGSNDTCGNFKEITYQRMLIVSVSYSSSNRRQWSKYTDRGNTINQYYWDSVNSII